MASAPLAIKSSSLRTKSEFSIVVWSSINPEEAERIHNRQGQHEGNNVPCTMCGGACVYIMLPQQRKYEDKDEIVSE